MNSVAIHAIGALGFTSRAAFSPKKGGCRVHTARAFLDSTNEFGNGGGVHPAPHRYTALSGGYNHHGSDMFRDLVDESQVLEPLQAAVPREMRVMDG